MSHRERGPGVPHPIIQRPDEETESAPEAPTSETDELMADAHLAGSALIAAPGTIADEVAPSAADAQSEVERLRAALFLGSQEIDTLQASWGGPGADVFEPETKDEIENSSEERGALLDAASARRLAADARRRERESRAALEAAQRALGTDPAEPEGHAVAPPEQTGWQQRALVARNPSETTEAGPPTAEASASTETEAMEPAADVTLVRSVLDPVTRSAHSDASSAWSAPRIENANRPWRSRVRRRGDSEKRSNGSGPPSTNTSELPPWF